MIGHVHITEHNCDGFDTITTLSERSSGYSRESLRISQCRTCGQVWLIRHQWDSGTGSDHLSLRPGESARGYSFTQEDADNALAKVPAERDAARLEKRRRRVLELQATLTAALASVQEELRASTTAEVAREEPQP